MRFEKTDIVNIILLLCAASLWASAFSAIKIAVGEVGPLTVAAARCLIAGLVLTPFLLQSHLLKELRSAPLIFLSFVGFVGVAVPFMLVSYGEQYVDSSLAGLLMAIGPLATLIGAHYITRDELITRQRLGGILLGFAGVVLLLWQGSRLIGQTAVLGQLAILAAALGYVSSNLMIRRISGKVAALIISWSGLAFSAVLLVPAAIVIEAPDIMAVSVPTISALLWLGLMPTALGFTLRYILIARAGAGFTSYVGYLIPAIALLFGVILLDEPLSWDRLAGLALILVGLALARR